MSYEPQNKINMKLDIVRFKNNEQYGTYRFIDSDEMEVEQTADEDFPSGEIRGYYESRNAPYSPYSFYSEYDERGNIRKSMKFFYTIPIGFSVEYDDTGQVINKENMDASYKFFTDDLISKMKEEYDIDLLNKKDKFAIRYQEQNHLGIPLYEVHYNIASSSLKNVYLVNGNTGETIFIAKRTTWETAEDEGISVLDEYINSLKK